MAEDEDTVGNLVYSIQQVKPSDFNTLTLFTINRLSGVVTVASNDSSDIKLEIYEVIILFKII